MTPESIPAAELIGREFQAEPVPSNCYPSLLTVHIGHSLMLIIHDSRKVLMLCNHGGQNHLSFIQQHKKFSFLCSVNKVLVHLPKHMST